MLSVHVHEKGGARGPREHEETVLAARRYDGYQCIYDVAAAANIVKHELDGSRCEIRAFLTKIDVWNPVAIPRSLPVSAVSLCNLIASFFTAIA